MLSSIVNFDTVAVVDNASNLGANVGGGGLVTRKIQRGLLCRRWAAIDSCGRLVSNTARRGFRGQPFAMGDRLAMPRHSVAADFFAVQPDLARLQRVERHGLPSLRTIGAD